SAGCDRGRAVSPGTPAAVRPSPDLAARVPHRRRAPRRGGHRVRAAASRERPRADTQAADPLLSRGAADRVSRRVREPEESTERRYPRARAFGAAQRLEARQRRTAGPAPWTRLTPSWSARDRPPPSRPSVLAAAAC